MTFGARRKRFGQSGEAAASAFLVQKGYRLLAANFRTSAGEIDLVCRDAHTLVFVEVKTRRTDAFGAPEDAVTIQKQQKIRRVAEGYLAAHGWQGAETARFDVVSLTPAPDGVLRAELFRDAFQF